MIAISGKKISSAFILFIFLLPFVPVAGEIPPGDLPAPKEPAEPAVDVRGKKAGAGGADFPVTVFTAKGSALTGSLILKFDAIEIETAGEGHERTKSISLSSVESIEFMRWRGALRRKNEYAFYPALAKITLRDKKTYECLRITPAFGRLMLKNHAGSRFIYVYFFDYRNGKTWKNSGETGMNFPETNPLAGTVVRIDFTAAEMKNPLEMLFRQLVPNSL
jgi:hypothetical protein